MMSKHTKNFYDGDFEIEGVVMNVLFGAPTEEEVSATLSGRSVKHTLPRPTAKLLDQSMARAVAKCRDLELSEEEIEGSIRLNLRTYEFNDSTFPVDRWLGREPNE